MHISAGDLRIAVHLPYIRDDNRALWDVVAFVVIVSDASMGPMIEISFDGSGTIRRDFSQCYGSDWSPMENFLDHSTDVREPGHISKCGDPGMTYN